MIRSFIASITIAVLGISGIAVASECSHPTTPSVSHSTTFPADELGLPGETVATQHAAAEVCFPFKDWAHYSIDRDPCYTVSRPLEDGSGNLRIGTVGNDQAVCLIPNVTEERGQFAIHCHRVGR